MDAQHFPLGVTAVMLPELDFDQQIELCAQLGVTHYCLRPRVIPEGERGKPYSNWGNHRFDLTPARLIEQAVSIRDRLEIAGLVPYATLPHARVDDDDDTLERHFEGAASVGAKCVRVAPKPYPAEVFDYSRLLEQTIKGYKHAVKLAQAHSLKIVIETHCRSLACSPALAWNICRHFDPVNLGVILDLPNFAREGEINAALGVSVLAAHIDHCHVGGCRRVDRGRDEAGCRRVEHEMCPLTESDLPITRWLTIMRDAGLQVPLVIEDFTANLPGAERLRKSVESLRRLPDQ